MNSITELSAIEIAKRIKSGEMMVKECVIAFAEEIKLKNEKIGAFSKIDLDKAFKQAADVQRRIDKKESVSVLAGVPFAVCDNVFAEGFEASCGSQMMDGFKNTYTATVIERMKKAGAIFLGNICMSEFGISAVNSTAHKNKLKNPWNPLKSAGTNGAGAAIISGMIPIVIGTDNGTGVSMSAAFCGATSLTVSEGTVSRYGIFSAVPSIERVAVAAKTASDIAAVLQIIGCSDNKDPICTRKSIILPIQPVKYMKIGVPKELTVDLQPDIRARVLSVPEGMRQMGAEVDVFSMPVLKKVPAASYIISSAEISASLARYDGRTCTTRNIAGKTASEIRGERFEYETKSRIMLGNSFLSEGNYESLYIESVRIRKTLAVSFEKIFETFDIVAAPVVGGVAPDLGSDDINDEFSLLDHVSAPALAGLPYAVIPCGYTEDSMPVGCMLISKKNCEANLLSAAVAFQKVTGYHEITAKI